MFVIYESEEASTIGAKFMVQLVVNEQIVRWEGVLADSDEQGLLPLHIFLALLNTKIQDFATVCQTNVTTNNQSYS